MKNIKLPANVTRVIGRATLQIKKHSPELLAIVGVVSFGITIVTACSATIKAREIMDEMNDTIDKIHDVADNPDNDDKYTDEDVKKDLAITYAQTGVKLAKVYTPSIVFGVASISCFVSSNHILKNRNVALAAAYATLDNGFKSYRKNAVERFGNNVDRELKYNIKAKEFKAETSDEKGNKSTETTVKECIDPQLNSPYARFFDSSSREWVDDPEYNLMFLRKVEKFMNDKLISQGYLFLNDVYDELDIPRTRAGQCVGWIYDTKNPIGDNYVDFGIYDGHRWNEDAARRFVNGYENVILLDFNVDGNILDLF